MDFSTLNTKTGANKGAFLHLKHPALGHKLYSGDGADDLGHRIDPETAEAVGVFVIGLESEVARERARQIQKARMKGGADDDDDDADERGMDFVCGLVTAFTGIEDSDGNPLNASDEAKREFFRQSDNLIEQVMAFAQERSNFFKVASSS